jgi:hypothetical protein
MEHYLKGPGGEMPPMEIDYGLTPATKTSSGSWDDRRGEPGRASGQYTATPWPLRGCPCCIGW